LQIEEMAVDVTFTGDPPIAAVLSLREIGQMVNEMLEENCNHLPQFKRFKAQQNPRRMLPQA
jgi:hypothetical protein